MCFNFATEWPISYFSQSYDVISPFLSKSVKSWLPGCGVCIAVCPYEASKLKKTEEELKSSIDLNKCKRCGVCITACPAGARTIKDEVVDTVAGVYESL